LGQDALPEPSQASPLDPTPDELKRIAAILNVNQQVAQVFSEKLGHNFALHAEGALPNDNTAQNLAKTEERTADLSAIDMAATRALLDINRTLLVIERRKSNIKADPVLMEQHAYKRTKILNAFLGTTIGILGSGMQFSNSSGVQHAGDAVSVGGGAVSVIFALCTAGVDEIDSPANLPPIIHDLPKTVTKYLSEAAPATLNALQLQPTPKPSRNKLLSCHFHGAPSPAMSTVEETRNMDTLAEKLSDMSGEIGALLDAVSEVE
jgi:hypothetical protein